MEVVNTNNGQYPIGIIVESEEEMQWLWHALNTPKDAVLNRASSLVPIPYDGLNKGMDLMVWKIVDDIMRKDTV